MSATSEQRPVFVYGTLRPGQPNWERLLAGRSERVVPGRLPGAVLLDCGHYPAAVERTGGTSGGVVGDVLWFRPGDWAEVLAALDHLEGYHPDDPGSLFERVVRSVDTADGPVECWFYLAGRELTQADPPVLAEGDWLAHCRDLAEYRRHWGAIAEAGGRAPYPDDR